MKRAFVDLEAFSDEDDEDDLNQENEAKKFEVKTSAVIYLIDAREKMFLPSFEEDKLPIILCLESVRLAVRTKIFRMEKCLCSIILLGTKKCENPLSLSNIFVVQELSFLAADHVLKIDQLIKCVENLHYENEYGYEKFSLGDAFWLCSHIFNQKSKDLHKTIVMLTNDDNPPSDDSTDEKRAFVIAQDLFKSSITFDFIPLGENFDVCKFYKKIILASKNDAKYVIPDPASNINDIVDRITKTNFQHVTLFKLPFVISEDFRIGVSVHFLVKKAKIPFKVKLSKATNEKVITKTAYFEEETGSEVKPNDLIKTQIFAQKEINFRLSELKAIKEFGNKELKLLGFKPASILRLEYFVKPCAFIYPDDKSYKGSSIFFTALLKRCAAKQVVPICTFCPRMSSSYRFVALIPQEECMNNDKTRQLPPGFVVFFLPFAEEIRTVEDYTTEKASPEQVEIAVKLIKKLKFPYKVSCFQNPKIKQHWAAIEALALDLPEPEEVNDCTIPNYDLMAQRCGKIAQEFIDSVYEEDYDPELFPFANKPKTKTKAKAKPEPKPKPTKDMTEENAKNVEEYVKMGKGIMLQKDVLKNYLISVGITKGFSKMKKADLLDKIEAHLNLK